VPRHTLTAWTRPGIRAKRRLVNGRLHVKFINNEMRSKTMSERRKISFGIAVMGGCLLAARAVVAADFDQGFLDDYSKLQPRSAGEFSDLFYGAPDLFSRISGYTGVALDQPEVLISPASPYKGGKPEDMTQIAELMRSALAEQLTKGGYNVVEARGPGVIFVRLALTDLELTKKKRGLLSYTPVGAVVKAGTDAVKETLDKVDITRMTLQAELLDGESGELLAALVVARGTPEGGKGARIEFEELTGMLSEYGARMRCGLDNAKVAQEQQINCLDPAARAGKYGAATRQ